MTRTRPGQPRRRDGFTLVEVMTAVALLTVAATGIITMQAAATKANQLSQETTVAVDFAQTWMERLKRDSLQWTAIGENARTAVAGSYIGMATTGAGTDTWNVPPIGTINESPAADAYGFDVALPDATGSIRYCMGFRNVVQHLANDPLSGTLDTDTIRIDVRVWWNRKNFDQTIGGMAAGNCNNVPADVGSRQDLRVVYLSSVLRWENAN